MVCDTLTRTDPAIVVLQATEATPVFLDQDRANLDGNVDASGPRGGWFLTNTIPPVVMPGAKFKLWARAGADTEIEVQVIEQRFEVNAIARIASHQPNAPSRLPSRSVRQIFGGDNFNNKVTF